MREVSACDRFAMLGRDYHSVEDIIDGRVVEPTPPAWCEGRGLTDYLLGLSDDALLRMEMHGVQRDDAVPAALADIARMVRRELGGWPQLAAVARPVEAPGASVRKRTQVAAFVEQVVRGLPRATRIVDFGAGLGHLTHALQSTLRIATLGLEHDGRRVVRARESVLSGAQFDVRDASAEQSLESGDLAVGLHACGDLGDSLLRQAVRASAHVMLVSCCLQKVRSRVRPALSSTGRHVALSFSHVALSLSNLSNWRDPAKLLDIHRSRETRQALRQLLIHRGVALQPGEETHGVHRRKFKRGLAMAAPLACRHRDLTAPSDEEVRHFEGLARREYAVLRRLSLPRILLGRLVECAVVLDRAAYLEEHGYRVRTHALVPSDVTPRNLTIVAAAGSGGRG